MKPKLYKQEETQVYDQSSKSSISTVSRKSYTSASFFDRLAVAETFATQQTRKQNRGKNDGTFAEFSKTALMRDFKGGTYLHGKMDPVTERGKTAAKQGELVRKTSLNKPLKNQEFYDRMTYHETFASAQNRKQAREESDSSTFAEANKSALLRDYKDSTEKQKTSLNKPLKNQEFYDRMTYHETYASAQNRKQAREESDSSTFAEANKSALLRDYKGSTEKQGELVRKTSLNKLLKNQEFYDRITYHETFASAQHRKQARDESNIRSFVFADEEKIRKAIYTKKLKNQSFYERMANHETFASAQHRKQARDESNIRSFVFADEEKIRKAIYTKKLKNQSFYERLANHETFASAQNRKQAREESESSLLVEANNSTIPGMDPALVRKKLLVDEEKNRKAINAKNLKNQSFYERLANHETFTSAETRKQNFEKQKICKLIMSLDHISLDKIGTKMLTEMEQLVLEQWQLSNVRKECSWELESHDYKSL